MIGRASRLRRIATAALFVGVWCVIPSASMQKPAAPTPSLFRPPPTDNPADADVADLASAAYNSGMASVEGEIIALYSSGSYADWVDALMMCEYFNVSPCPPIDDGREPPEAPPTDAPKEQPKPAQPVNADVIPLNGDSATPPDEVIGGTPEPIEPRSGPFLGEPASSDALPAPVMIATVASAGVMELRVYSPNGLPLQQRKQLLHMHGVLAPLTSSASGRIASRLVAFASPGGGGVHLSRVTVRTYCLEANKRAPAKDTVYVWAPKAYQEQFAQARPVRQVSEFAAAHGFLRPQGDAAAYGRFITQYAIWTTFAHWDWARFADEFVSRTRDEMLAANERWSAETERTLRALAPARWRDIQLVIRATDAVRSKGRGREGSVQ